MKTPREAAQEFHFDGAEWAFDDQESEDACVDATEKLLAARDAEHSRRTELAREVLRDVGYSKREPGRCGMCAWQLEKCCDDNCRGFRARTALEALEEK